MATSVSKVAVATDEVRRVVERLQRDGLPEAVPARAVVAQLSADQSSLMCRLAQAAAAEDRYEATGLEEGSLRWSVRVEIRRLLLKALEMGLAHVGAVQRHLVAYGAMPDGSLGGRYYRRPDGILGCWGCGALVVVQEVADSVHDSPISLAGSGKTKGREVLFCPECEEGPRARIIDAASCCGDDHSGRMCAAM